MSILLRQRLFLGFFLGLLLAGPAWAAPASTDVYQRGMQKMHQDMHIVYSGQVDSDFARGMVPHHQGAIDMAEVALRYGKDDMIRELARFIRVSQQAEIARMNGWITRRATAEPAGELAETQKTEAYSESQAAMQAMHQGMNIAYGGDADADFVCGMIPHHQGAIDMAWIEIRYGSDPEMLALARTIIPAQSSDIARMHRWLKERNLTCSPAQGETKHHH